MWCPGMDIVCGASAPMAVYIVEGIGLYNHTIFGGYFWQHPTNVYIGFVLPAPGYVG